MARRVRASLSRCAPTASDVGVGVAARAATTAAARAVNEGRASRAPHRWIGRRASRVPNGRRAVTGRPSDRPERGEGGPIPNPLQQTFDKRAIQQARAQREISEDGPIPNPLQQTFDKRAIQQERSRRVEINEDGPIPNPLQQTYDKRFVQKGPGSNANRTNANRGARGKNKQPSAPRQPDPMQTAVGYIGADAFTRKSAGRGGRPGAGRGKPPGRGGGRR